MVPSFPEIRYHIIFKTKKQNKTKTKQNKKTKTNTKTTHLTLKLSVHIVMEVKTYILDMKHCFPYTRWSNIICEKHKLKGSICIRMKNMGI